MREAVPICLQLLTQAMVLDLSLALESAGSNIAARIAMMAMTTNSSIKVKADRAPHFWDARPDVITALRCFIVVPIELELSTNPDHRLMTYGSYAPFYAPNGARATWILVSSHPRFSFARRTTISVSSGEIKGLPGRRFLFLSCFLAITVRYQLINVCGDAAVAISFKRPNVISLACAANRRY
jgi:hypothetical protein